MKKFYNGSVTCLPSVHPESHHGFARNTPWIGRDRTHYPGLTLHDALRDLPEQPPAAKTRLICSCKFSSNVRRNYHTRTNCVYLYFQGCDYLESEYLDALINPVQFRLDYSLPVGCSTLSAGSRDIPSGLGLYEVLTERASSCASGENCPRP